MLCATIFINRDMNTLFLLFRIRCLLRAIYSKEQKNIAHLSVFARITLDVLFIDGLGGCFGNRLVVKKS